MASGHHQLNCDFLFLLVAVCATNSAKRKQQRRTDEAGRNETTKAHPTAHCHEIETAIALLHYSLDGITFWNVQAQSEAGREP